MKWNNIIYWIIELQYILNWIFLFEIIYLNIEYSIQIILLFFNDVDLDSQFIELNTKFYIIEKWWKDRKWKIPYFFLLFWIIIFIFSLMFEKVKNLMIGNFWIYSFNWLYFLYNFDQIQKIVNHFSDFFDFCVIEK